LCPREMCQHTRELVEGAAVHGRPQQRQGSWECPSVVHILARLAQSMSLKASSKKEKSVDGCLPHPAHRIETCFQGQVFHNRDLASTWNRSLSPQS
jgi:hypothetical protein